MSTEHQTRTRDHEHISRRVRTNQTETLVLEHQYDCQNTTIAQVRLHDYQQKCEDMGYTVTAKIHSPLDIKEIVPPEEFSHLPDSDGTPTLTMNTSSRRHALGAFVRLSQAVANHCADTFVGSPP